MKIILNGEASDISEGISIHLNPETVVVEMDGKIIPLAQLKDTYLYEDVKLEVLRFVGGG